MVYGGIAYAGNRACQINSFIPIKILIVYTSKAFRLSEKYRVRKQKFPTSCYHHASKHKDNQWGISIYHYNKTHTEEETGKSAILVFI